MALFASPFFLNPSSGRYYRRWAGDVDPVGRLPHVCVIRREGEAEPFDHESRCGVGGHCFLWEQARKAARRWFTESQAEADEKRDRALRRIGADILHEPIPEKLLDPFHGEQNEAETKPKRRK